MIMILKMISQSSLACLFLILSRSVNAASVPVKPVPAKPVPVIRLGRNTGLDLNFLKKLNPVGLRVPSLASTTSAPETLRPDQRSLLVAGKVVAVSAGAELCHQKSVSFCAGACERKLVRQSKSKILDGLPEFTLDLSIIRHDAGNRERQGALAPRVRPGRRLLTQDGQPDRPKRNPVIRSNCKQAWPDEEESTGQ